MNIVKLHDNRIILINGDCLEVLPKVKPNSVDMVFADLPYGTTACKWDTPITLNKLWYYFNGKNIGGMPVINGCCKVTTPYVATCAFPFTVTLGNSNIEQLKYDLAWDKVNKYTDSLNANRKPMRRHENILVFYAEQCTFNKQYRSGKARNTFRTNGHGEYTGTSYKEDRREFITDGEHFNPCTVLQIKADNKKEVGLHPTQKPVELLEYLIKTYTNENDVVLDPTAGSGTTAVACINTNRRCIAIEKDTELGYFNTMLERCNAAIAELYTNVI